MVVQVCDGLENEDLEPSGRSCDSVSSRMSSCFSQHVIAVWGRGEGERVSDI